MYRCRWCRTADVGLRGAKQGRAAELGQSKSRGCSSPRMASGVASTKETEQTLFPRTAHKRPLPRLKLSPMQPPLIRNTYESEAAPQVDQPGPSEYAVRDNIKRAHLIVQAKAFAIAELSASLDVDEAHLVWDGFMECMELSSGVGSGVLDGRHDSESTNLELPMTPFKSILAPAEVKSVMSNVLRSERRGRRKLQRLQIIRNYFLRAAAWYSDTTPEYRSWWTLAHDRNLYFGMMESLVAETVQLDLRYAFDLTAAFAEVGAELNAFTLWKTPEVYHYLLWLLLRNIPRESSAFFKLKYHGRVADRSETEESTESDVLERQPWPCIRLAPFRFSVVVQPPKGQILRSSRTTAALALALQDQMREYCGEASLKTPRVRMANLRLALLRGEWPKIRSLLTIYVDEGGLDIAMINVLLEGILRTNQNVLSDLDADARSELVNEIYEHLRGNELRGYLSKLQGGSGSEQRSGFSSTLAALLGIDRFPEDLLADHITSVLLIKHHSRSGDLPRAEAVLEDFIQTFNPENTTEEARPPSKGKADVRRSTARALYYNRLMGMYLNIFEGFAKHAVPPQGLISLNAASPSDSIWEPRRLSDSEEVSPWSVESLSQKLEAFLKIPAVPVFDEAERAARFAASKPNSKKEETLFLMSGDDRQSKKMKRLLSEPHPRALYATAPTEVQAFFMLIALRRASGDHPEWSLRQWNRIVCKFSPKRLLGAYVDDSLGEVKAGESHEAAAAAEAAKWAGWTASGFIRRNVDFLGAKLKRAREQADPNRRQ